MTGGRKGFESIGHLSLDSFMSQNGGGGRGRKSRNSNMEVVAGSINAHGGYYGETRLTDEQKQLIDEYTDLVKVMDLDELEKIRDDHQEAISQIKERYAGIVNRNEIALYQSTGYLENLKAKIDEEEWKRNIVRWLIKRRRE